MVHPSPHRRQLLILVLVLAGITRGVMPVAAYAQASLPTETAASDHQRSRDEQRHGAMGDVARWAVGRVHRPVATREPAGHLHDQSDGHRRERRRRRALEGLWIPGWFPS